MAEKKTTTKKTTAPKKASKQAKPKAVDMVSPVTPADETGLELTEKMKMQEVVSDEVIELGYVEGFLEDVKDIKEIEPKETTV